MIDQQQTNQRCLDFIATLSGPLVDMARELRSSRRGEQYYRDLYERAVPPK